jgi:hypothetical protein
MWSLLYVLVQLSVFVDIEYLLDLKKKVENLSFELSLLWLSLLHGLEDVQLLWISDYLSLWLSFDGFVVHVYL